MSRHGWVSARAARLIWAALGVALLVLSQVTSGVSAGFRWPFPVAAEAASGGVGQPNRRAGAVATKSVNHLPPPPKAQAGAKPAYSPPRALTVSMNPALVPLDPVAGAHFVGSDQVLEVTVPPGAVTAADV